MHITDETLLDFCSTISSKKTLSVLFGAAVMCRNFKSEAPAEVCCAFIPFSPVCDGLLTCYHLVFGQGRTMEVWSEIN